MDRFVGILLASALLMGAVPPAQGQETPQVGLALGLNVTTLEAPGNLGMRQMATGGVVARMGIAGPVSVESQLLLSQKGATVREPSSIRYGAGYVDLPLLLRVDGPSIGPVTLYGMGGGFGGVKVFEQQRAGGDLSLPLPNTGTSFFRRTNAGITGGIGGTFSIGQGRRLNLAVRYEHGLTDVARSIAEQPYDRAPFPSEARTRTWSIMLRFGV